MAASLDDSRPAFNQRTYAACSNSAILVGRVGFPSTSVRQRQRADAHGAFNQRTYAACSDERVPFGWAVQRLQPAHICCLQQDGKGLWGSVQILQPAHICCLQRRGRLPKRTTRRPSTSAHMLLAAEWPIINDASLDPSTSAHMLLAAMGG